VKLQVKATFYTTSNSGNLLFASIRRLLSSMSGVYVLSLQFTNTGLIKPSSLSRIDYRLRADSLAGCLSGSREVYFWNSVASLLAERSEAKELASNLQTVLNNGSIANELSKITGTTVCAAPNATVIVLGPSASAPAAFPVWSIVVITIVGAVLLASCCGLLVFAVLRRRRVRKSETEDQEQDPPTDVEEAAPTPPAEVGW
jgi:hypothetical protein